MDWIFLMLNGALYLIAAFVILIIFLVLVFGAFSIAAKILTWLGL
jgi:hypothetical protein